MLLFSQTHVFIMLFKYRAEQPNARIHTCCGHRTVRTHMHQQIHTQTAPFRTISSFLPLIFAEFGMEVRVFVFFCDRLPLLYAFLWRLEMKRRAHTNDIQCVLNKISKRLVGLSRSNGIGKTKANDKRNNNKNSSKYIFGLKSVFSMLNKIGSARGIKT